MRFDIRYQCRFVYDQLVRESQNELRACPTTDAHQTLVSYRVQTDPAGRVFSFTDWFGTRADAFGVREPHLVLDVVAEATVETRPRPLVTLDPPVAMLTGHRFRDEHHEYLARTPHAAWDDAVAAEAARCAELAGPGIVSRVLAIHRFVGSRLTYQPGATYVGVDVGEVLARGVGVCQDYAHLSVAMCRSVGIPARYVSGYLFTVDDSTGEDVGGGAGLDGDTVAGGGEAGAGGGGGGGLGAGGGADGTAVRVQTHAWIEAAVPGLGWLALDPTNGLMVGPRHVKIGHGRDYDDVPPLRGVYSGTAECELEVAVDIRRLEGAASRSLGSPGRPARAEGRILVAREEEAALRRAEKSREQQHQAQQQ